MALSFGGFLGLSACSVEDPGAGPQAGTTQPGTHGLLKLALIPEGSVQEGTNGFRLEVWDAATNSPIAGAKPTARIVMPSMGHETGPQDALEVGGGKYDLTSVVFDMPGAWSVRLRVEKGALVDEAEFQVQVP